MIDFSACHVATYFVFMANLIITNYINTVEYSSILFWIVVCDSITFAAFLIQFEAVQCVYVQEPQFNAVHKFLLIQYHWIGMLGSSDHRRSWLFT